MILVGVRILEIPAIDDDDGDGISEENGDCDDTNGQIFPGATDFPGDGIDQDCSGADATLIPGRAIEWQYGF